MPDPESVPIAEVLPILLQHFSNNWGEQCLEFTTYPFLITLYPYSFLPASILGLSITLATVLTSQEIGYQVDTQPRFWFVRRLILVQKLSQAGCYTIFLFLFHHPSPAAEPPAPINRPISWSAIGLLVILASVGRLATTGIDLAVCRDWVLVISRDHEVNAAPPGTDATFDAQANVLLSFLTTSLRRIGLLCKLLAPLPISLSTTLVGDWMTAVVLMGMAGLTLGSEMLWIGVVWRKFGTVLEEDEKERRCRGKSDEVMGDEGSCADETIVGAEMDDMGRMDHVTVPSRQLESRRGLPRSLLATLARTLTPWNEFRKMPIFLTSFSISCVCLTTLSFESILISYLKSEAHLSDLFIAVARGVSVAMGLVGTAVMPVLEKKLGLVRAGAWSIWGEVTSLVPVVLCLYIGPGPSAASSLPSIISTLTFFTSLSLSRLWLYCFDLVQLQSLMLALEHHPRRSEFLAMQVTMENVFDVAKFLLVLVLNKPEQYKWTAMVSLGAVAAAAVAYSFYLFHVRGHVFHFWPNRSKSNGRFANDQADVELSLLRQDVDR